MDDELLALEAELSRLVPVTPPDSLTRAVERQLTPTLFSAVLRHAWLTLPIAAGIAAMMVLSPEGAAPHSSIAGFKGSSANGDDHAPFKPVAAENLLLSSNDEGVVTLADGTQARRLRESYVDTITWRNPHTNASLTWSVPREQVRVVPVSYQ